MPAGACPQRAPGLTVGDVAAMTLEEYLTQQYAAGRLSPGGLRAAHEGQRRGVGL